MQEMPPPAVSAWVDGAPATADQLRTLAIANYGHFTSMQVHQRAVRGLDLHLQRLHVATQALFDVGLDPVRVRRGLLQALAAAGLADASARVTVFAPDFDHRQPERARDLCVLVTLSPPRAPVAAPLRVVTQSFERALPEIKHVGVFPLFALGRQARLAGADDALFVDAGGRISEGTVWNVGFWDGEAVVWPLAEALRGTTEQLLQVGLERGRLPQRWAEVRGSDLAGFRAAFAANAMGIRAIQAIDALDYDPAGAGELVERLHAIFCECAPQAL